MITQYTESYSSPSADIQNIVANSVSLIDQYVLIQTGQYEYTALIKNMANKKVEKIVFTRGSSNYNTQYSVEREEVSNFDYTVSNEYYTFSNVGFGKSLDIPSYEGAVTYGITAMTVVLFFAIMFKGVLFKCLRKR